MKTPYINKCTTKVTNRACPNRSKTRRRQLKGVAIDEVIIVEVVVIVIIVVMLMSILTVIVEVLVEG